MPKSSTSQTVPPPVPKVITSLQRSRSSVPQSAPAVSKIGKAPTAGTTRPVVGARQQQPSPVKSSLPKPPLPAPQAKLQRAESNLHETTFETTKLQSELLYLSLLHESAGSSLDGDSQSARRKVQQRFERLHHQSLKLDTEERAVQEDLNVSDLAQWTAHEDLVGQAQTLDELVRDLTSLVSTDGHYISLVSQFECWADRVEVVRRVRSGVVSVDQQLFLSPLPKEWHEVQVSVAQSIVLVKKGLQSLPPLPPSSQGLDMTSGLRSTVTTIRQLTSGIAEELQWMTDYEQVSLAQERCWIEEYISGLALHDDHETAIDIVPWR